MVVPINTSRELLLNLGYHRPPGLTSDFEGKLGALILDWLKQKKYNTKKFPWGDFNQEDGIFVFNIMFTR